MVAALAYQIFGVLRTPDDAAASFPPNPRREADPELLDPRPPAAPPEIPGDNVPVPPEVLSDNDPFDWRARDESSAADQENQVTLTLLAIRGEGDSAFVQIETDSSKKWYKVGDAFESFELLSVDIDEETAEVFDEGLNRVRVIEMEK